MAIRRVTHQLYKQLNHMKHLPAANVELRLSDMNLDREE